MSAKPYSRAILRFRLKGKHADNRTVRRLNTLIADEFEKLHSPDSEAMIPSPYTWGPKRATYSVNVTNRLGISLCFVIDLHDQ